MLRPRCWILCYLLSLTGGTLGALRVDAAPIAGAPRVKLVVWGLPSGEETKGLDAAIREFERRNPRIAVQNLSMGAGEMNAQKLMTSIVWMRSTGVRIGRTSPKPTPEMVITTM